MDARSPLRPQTELDFYNEEGGFLRYTIVREIGRGGSCIVYEAYRRTTTGDKKYYRIKECYPYKMHLIRQDDGVLTAQMEDALRFEEQKERFVQEFSLSNQLFYAEGMHSAMVDPMDVYPANNTMYIVSAYSSEKTLALYRPDSLKSCLNLVKKVAFVLENIHRQGFLYLDIKPDNILVIEDMEPRIQLFDFDSLVPLASLENRSGTKTPKLSYSKGFAAVELETAKRSRIGTATDVYGVGALLFWLLFGRTPLAPDCEEDAVYAFSESSYDFDCCDSKLKQEMSSLFHNLLASFALDRFQNMEEVVSALSKLEMLADPQKPRILQKKIHRPKYAYGRTQELCELDAFMANPDTCCLFVSGMGGIGKSTLIREYLSISANRFDLMMYADFMENMDRTISDDDNITINVLNRAKVELDGQRYFTKKLRMLRELMQDTKSVLVIDNFTGEIDADTKAVLSLGCKVILITRQQLKYTDCQILQVDAIRDTAVLQKIFIKNLGRGVSDEERKQIDTMISLVQGNTLVLELVAKQIANSYLSIQEAYALIEEYGFAGLAPEMVGYEKDGLTIQATIGTIIDKMYEKGTLTQEKKALLKVISLCEVKGIDIHSFRHLLKLPSFDLINSLIRESWLMLEEMHVSVHPVIAEAIRRWKWSSTDLSFAERMLQQLYREIHTECLKNEYPKSLYKKHQKAFPDSPADLLKLQRNLFLSQEIIRSVRKEKEIRSLSIYPVFRYAAVLNLPRYQEEFQLSQLEEILDEHRDVFAGKRLIHSGKEDTAKLLRLMKLLKLQIRIFDDKRDFQEMEYTCKLARNLAMQSKNAQIQAMYYDIFSDYYDQKLNGAYDYETKEEEHYYLELLKCMDRTLKYAKTYAQQDSMHLYTRTLLGKATALMRSGFDLPQKTLKQIERLLKEAEKMVSEQALPYADVRLQYYLVLIWYDALVLKDQEKTDKSVERARKLAEKILPTDLDLIDNVLVPSANVYYELQEPEQALSLLFEGITICSRQRNTEVYARKRQELCGYWLEVAIRAEVYEQCSAFIAWIERENEKILQQKLRVEISREVRDEIEKNLQSQNQK